MRHILFIDPLDKLDIKKDSSLLMALALKDLGYDVFLLFPDDFFIINDDIPQFYLYEFSGTLKNNSFYIETFKLKDREIIKIEKNDILHMRLDPPFDERYLRYLWQLTYLKNLGITVINDPQGIASFNEKILAFEYTDQTIYSFVGDSVNGFELCYEQMIDKSSGHLIMKPLNLYQGLGVEKIEITSKKEVMEHFKRKVKEVGGALVIQPYMKEVEKGEIRSLYFKGQEIGSILKVPQEGEYLANIARGASYSSYQLNDVQKKICDSITKRLMKYGVDFVAFDILENLVSEVNITCPGLLVEVSEAIGKNLATVIGKKI